MADQAQNLLDGLYRRLVLRDAFGKIAPGLLVLYSLEVHTKIHALVPGEGTAANIMRALLLIGSAWFIALGTQTVGEMSGLLRMWPTGMMSSETRYNLRIRFGRVATEDEMQQAERYALLGESAGVMATACLIVIVQSLVTAILTRSPAGFFLDPNGWLWRVGVGAAALALLGMHRSHCQKRYEYMQQVVKVAAEK